MTSTSSTTPLISSQDVKAHIALMRAIQKLQNDFQLGDVSPGIPPAPKTLDFLRHAVMRFGTWLNTLSNIKSAASSLKQIPPLDVLMVWHSYMLSPVPYWIDAQQGIPALASMGGMPWNLVSLGTLINSTSVTDRSANIAPMHQRRNS